MPRLNKGNDIIAKTAKNPLEGKIGDLSLNDVAFRSANVAGNINTGNIFAEGYYFANGNPFLPGVTNVVIATDAVAHGIYYPLFVSNVGTNSIVQVDSTAVAFTYDPGTGTVSATDFDSLSDVTFKENIEPIPEAMDLVKKLRGVSFQWKRNRKKSLGVIAQEVEQVLPELVNTRENGQKSVVYDNLIPLLIEATKQLQEQVDRLETKVQSLQREVSALKKSR